MPYSGHMPSLETIQQAVWEPLWRAPRDHPNFAFYFLIGLQKSTRIAATKKVAENASTHCRG